MTTSSPTSIDAHSDREHSDIVGGSSAERILNCPGSYAEQQKIPAAARNKSSVYADEGTALHEAIAYILENDIADPDEVLGMTFGVSDSAPTGFVITQEMVDDALAPCLDFFDALCEELDEEGGVEFLVECRAELPGIPGAFGTSDIIFRTDKRSGIVDWKFGVGKQVYASYPVEAVDKASGDAVPGKTVRRPNSQPMFYGRAGMYTFPKMFEKNPDWPVDLYIVQPRSRHLSEGDPIFSHYQTTVGELEEFRFKLIAAVAEAQGKDPRTKRGPWCEFQPCRATCPHHTGPMLDLSKLDLSALKKNEPGKEAVPTDWGKLYGEYLHVCELAEAIIKEIQSQAHSFAEAGHTVEGWKLVEKRASENYVDEDGAKRHAIGVGVDEKDVLTEPAIKSPAQLGKAMEPFMEGKTKKEREQAAREQIAQFTKKVSSGTTLAKDTDGRPDVTPTPTLLKNLAAKLESL